MGRYSSRRLRFATIALVAMSVISPAVAYAGSDTNEVPPFILAGKPRSIEPTLNGYRTVRQDGRTEYWMRTVNGYSSGSRHIMKTIDGYRDDDGSYARRNSGGWVVSNGGTNTTIRESLSGYVVGDTYIYRSVNGYRSSVAPSNGFGMSKKKTPVKRMKNSTPSSFRRWDESGKSRE